MRQRFFMEMLCKHDRDDLYYVICRFISLIICSKPKNPDFAVRRLHKWHNTYNVFTFRIKFVYLNITFQSAVYSNSVNHETNYEETMKHAISRRQHLVIIFTMRLDCFQPMYSHYTLGHLMEITLQFTITARERYKWIIMHTAGADAIIVRALYKHAPISPSVL